MTELELYKFVSDNELEYHWNDKEVYLFISVYRIADFNEMLGWHIMDERGIECTMKDKYLVFSMSDICDYFGININNVFTNKAA